MELQRSAVLLSVFLVAILLKNSPITRAASYCSLPNDGAHYLVVLDDASTNQAMTGRRFRSGTRIRVRCAGSSSSAQMTCQGSRWTSPLPTCGPPTCQPCIIPSCSSQLKLQDNSLPLPSTIDCGESLNLRCNAGYQLQGSSCITCIRGPNGFDNSFPTCAPMCQTCRIPSSASPFLRLTDGSSLVAAGSSFTCGYSLQLKCMSGFDLMGACTVTCMGGQWDNDFPQCMAQPPPPCTCQLPYVAPSLLKTDGSVVQTGPQTYNCGCSLNMQCSTGYVMQGTSSVTCQGGSWSCDFPQCVPACPARCTIPYSVSSSLTTMDGTLLYAGTSYDCGSSLALSCCDGFNLVGSSMLTCNGPNWSCPFPQCIPKCNPCSIPNNVDCNLQNAKDGSMLPPGLTWDCNCALNVQCPSGYTLQGASSLYCYGPNWDKSFPTCCPVCSIPNYVDPMLMQSDGTTFFPNQRFKCGKCLQFACDPAYDLIGASSASCVGPTWDQPWPTCQKRCNPCIAPMASSKLLQIDGSPAPNPGCSFDCGSQLSFRCMPGYDLVGACTVTCAGNGPNWDNNFPQCVCRSCMVPSSGLSPQLQTSDGTPICQASSSYECGCNLNLQCAYGYQLVGASSLSCQAGSWTCDFPTCQKMGCTLTTSFPANTCQYDGSPPPTYGSQIQSGSTIALQCSAGYQPCGGNSIFMCNGPDWTPSLSTPMLQCSPANPPLPACPLPQTVCQTCFQQANGQPMPPSVPAGQSLNLQCIKPRSRLIGSATVSCLGPQWGSTFPSCT